MKIGIVCYPTFGGSGVVATELGKALAEKGHIVHFITYDRPVRLGSFRKNIFHHEVNITDYPLFDYPPYEMVLASKMVDVARFEGLDLLHVHYAIPHASAAYTAKKILEAEGIKLPVVTTLHGTDITLLGRDASFEPVISFAINQSDAVTAVSESLRSDTYRQMPHVKADIKVIPNFVCLSGMNLPVDNEFKKSIAPNGEFILAHTSNFRPVKRVEDVISVFAKVRDRVPSKLMLIGDGPDRSSAEAMCRKINLCDDVIFLGKLKNPNEALANADLFLLTSEIESFGLAALEAMALRIPVISTDTGGIPEVNVHGVTGFLSRVGDVDDMANNALTILSGHESLQQFKNAAYERAKAFEINKILPLYESLYEGVIAQKMTV
jgi:L-malate glycosyltransferase